MLDKEIEQNSDEYYSSLAVDYIARELPIPQCVEDKLPNDVKDILSELKEQIKRDKPNVKTNIIGESVVSA